MTHEGAITQLKELMGTSLMPELLKPSLKAVIETLEMERSTGEWLWVGHDGAKLKWSCNSCGRGVEDQENFCPDCGKPMKKEKKNEYKRD